MPSLTGKVAVVIGGGNGIGEASALCLSEQGARVVVGDLDGDAAAGVAEQVTDAGGQAIGRGVDVGDDASVRALMLAAVSHFGRLDVLHNNVASAARSSRAGDDDAVAISLDAWDEALKINLRGMLLGCRHAIPLMLEGGGGAIVNTASISAVTGEAARAAYSSSKAGVVGLTRHVALRWGKQGIRANAIAPGLTLTRIARAALSESARAAVLERVPSPRLAQPRDIGSVAAFLLSDDAFMIQGQLICVDGGQTLASGL